jgi:hypothetical protein
MLVAVNKKVVGLGVVSSFARDLIPISKHISILHRTPYFQERIAILNIGKHFGGQCSSSLPETNVPFLVSSDSNCYLISWFNWARRTTLDAHNQVIDKLFRPSTSEVLNKHTDRGTYLHPLRGAKRRIIAGTSENKSHNVNVGRLGQKQGSFGNTSLAIDGSERADRSNHPCNSNNTQDEIREVFRRNEALEVR